MTIVALLFVPWINFIRDGNVVPRVLADDLMVVAIGLVLRVKTSRALKLSKRFFGAIGAKVANNECFTFAHDKETRAALKDYVWDKQGLKIPCLGAFRDLGAHRNCTASQNGVTLTKRIMKASAMTIRLSYLQIDKATKRKIINSNILPAALYGAETSYVCRAAMQKLRSSIAGAIGARGENRNVNLTFDCCPDAKDLDPCAHLLYNKQP